MTMDEFQEYRKIKRLVDCSYFDEAERKDVWLSLRQLLLRDNELEFWPEPMEIFSQILVSGKPLCHMDIPVDAGESISFSDLLDNPLVSFPFTYTMLQGDDGKKICRFFYVNPDALEAEDFTFKSKLALKDTCVICVWTAERALHTGDLFKIEGTNLPNTMKFSVCCVVDETGVQYGGVFENRWIPNGEEFEVAEIKNEEKDLQKKFCEGIRAVFPDMKKMREYVGMIRAQMWEDLIQKKNLERNPYWDDSV